jgi:thiosulfate reductase cytochrome b subunit
MGIASAAMCIFSLADLISALIIIQTLLQTIGQCVAVILLRRKSAPVAGAFRMPLFPLPALAALVGWVFIIATSQTSHMVAGFALAAAGVGCYLITAVKQREWPFRQA